MKQRLIKKTGTAANMADYDATRASFDWATAQASLDGLSDGHLNIAHEAIDRHVAAGHGDQIALRWIAKSGARTDYTYAELSRQTNRFANVLRARGLQKGDKVYDGNKFIGTSLRKNGPPNFGVWALPGATVVLTENEFSGW